MWWTRYEDFLDSALWLNVSQKALIGKLVLAKPASSMLKNKYDPRNHKKHHEIGVSSSSYFV